MEEKRLQTSVRLVGLVALTCLLLGCGERKSTVNGTLTFDGQPVQSGMITFVRSEGELVREGAVIQSGAFRVTLEPGEYKIELSAQKVVGKRKQKGFDGKDEEVELSEELFPERFNTKTTLMKKVGPGTNTMTLDIKGTN